MAENTQVANFNTQLSYYTNRYVDLMERDLTSRGMEFDSYSKDCVVAAMGSIFQMVHESGVSFEAINGSRHDCHKCVIYAECEHDFVRCPELWKDIGL